MHNAPPVCVPIVLIDLHKETTSLLGPLFGGPEVRFHELYVQCLHLPTESLLCIPTVCILQLAGDSVRTASTANRVTEEDR